MDLRAWLCSFWLLKNWVLSTPNKLLQNKHSIVFWIVRKRAGKCFSLLSSSSFSIRETTKLFERFSCFISLWSEIFLPFVISRSGSLSILRVKWRALAEILMDESTKYQFSELLQTLEKKSALERLSTVQIAFCDGENPLDWRLYPSEASSSFSHWPSLVCCTMCRDCRRLTNFYFKLEREENWTPSMNYYSREIIDIRKCSNKLFSNFHIIFHIAYNKLSCSFDRSRRARQRE